MYPTETLYQSAQYCVIPPWAKNMKNGHPVTMEYQVKTEKMHLFDKNDLDAAHDAYKKISALKMDGELYASATYTAIFLTSTVFWKK